jgi:beta-lactam-binding protein with PASTA domain
MPVLLAVIVFTSTACVTRTTTVTVTATLPNATVTVPNVVGLRLDPAKHKLAARGLKAEVKVVTGGYPTGVVTGQLPNAGGELPPGAAVRLVIGPGGF